MWQLPVYIMQAAPTGPFRHLVLCSYRVCRFRNAFSFPGTPGGMGFKINQIPGSAGAVLLYSQPILFTGEQSSSIAFPVSSLSSFFYPPVKTLYYMR